MDAAGQSLHVDRAGSSRVVLIFEGCRCLDHKVRLRIPRTEVATRALFRPLDGGGAACVVVTFTVTPSTEPSADPILVSLTSATAETRSDSAAVIVDPSAAVADVAIDGECQPAAERTSTPAPCARVCNRDEGRIDAVLCSEGGLDCVTSKASHVTSRLSSVSTTSTSSRPGQLNHDGLRARRLDVYVVIRAPRAIEAAQWAGLRARTTDGRPEARQDIHTLRFQREARGVGGSACWAWCGLGGANLAVAARPARLACQLAVSILELAGGAEGARLSPGGGGE